MKAFHVDCELDYQVTQPTVFVFNLGAPSDSRQQVIAESITLNPQLVWQELAEPGTGNRLFRVDVGSGDFSIRYMATVEIRERQTDSFAPELPIPALPAEALVYLRSSRYCESDTLFNVALRQFGGVAHGHSRVESICQWIRESIDYLIGTSTPTYSARDVLAQRAGVCRDFAHVGITLCRALNIPARFVTGYAVYADPPPDFHAVFEAFLGGEWWLFDPTGLSPTSDLIRIGTGRDALDVPFATFFGQARLRRLSPLVEPAAPGDTLMALQTPDSGILLAA